MSEKPLLEGATVHGVAKKTDDFRTQMLEEQLRQSAEAKARAGIAQGKKLLAPPRFGIVNKQERLFFDELPMQLKLLTAKTLLNGDRNIGFSVLNNDPLAQYETIGAVMKVGDRIIIHQWAYDLEPPANTRAAVSFNSLAELVAFVQDPVNESALQGDIVTFIVDRRSHEDPEDPRLYIEEVRPPLKEMCEAFIKMIKGAGA